jgi:excisionase family DNA binding protein
MDSYLTFDEAVIFLKTNTSTLYKWLQSGKVPAHKLGRQWRFVREELENWLAGKGQGLESKEEARLLARFMADRNDHMQLTETDSAQVLQNLVRDAVQQNASAIHLYLAKGRYEIAYRVQEFLKPVTSLSEELFNQLHQAFIDLSFPLQNESARGAYLQKKHDNPDKKWQILYQKTETLNGSHITLKIVPDNLKLLSLEQIARDAEVHETFQKWASWNNGIIIVSGMVGNGMTTSTCSFLNHVRNQGKKVFLIQDFSEILFPELNPIEVMADNEQSFMQTLKQVMASDTDAIGITLDPASDLEPLLFKAAFRAASKGHLVIMQFNAATCEVVVEKIKMHASDILDNKIRTGISHQTLIPVEGNKRRPEYKLLELN